MTISLIASFEGAFDGAELSKWSVATGMVWNGVSKIQPLFRPIRYMEFGYIDGSRAKAQSTANPVACAAITSTSASDATNTSRTYRTNVQVTDAKAGLSKDTVFLRFQVGALDPSRFPAHPAGTMQATRMTEVDAALRLVLSL